MNILIPKKKLSHQLKSKLIQNIPKHTFYRQKTKIFKDQWLSAKELYGLFNEKIQLHNREEEDNKIVTMYLVQLNPFAENLFKIIGTKGLDVINHLSSYLTYSSFNSDTVLYRFMESSDTLNIILDGRIDMLIPNKQKYLLTKEEYFIYLLKLRRFNEIELLKSVININQNQFEVNEKSFDNWVSSAYYSCNFIETKLKSKEKAIILNNKINKANEIDDYINIGGVNFLMSAVSNKTIQSSFVKEIALTYQAIEKETQINNELKSIAAISSIDFINRIKPIQTQSNRTECKLVIIFLYHNIGSKGKGEIFGEMMCDKNYRNDNHKHYLTLITSSQTQLCSLSRNRYNLILKDIYEKGRLEKINYLSQIGIFNSTKSFVFKNFSSFFIKRELKNKEYLFKEDAICGNDNMISFILSGEFKLTCKKSITEIGKLIKLNKSKQDQDTCLELLNKNKEYNEKREFQLHSFGVNDIIGLNDCIYKGIYLFSVQCASNQAIIFQIHSKIFELMKNTDPIISASVENIERLKKNILKEYLSKQRDFRVESIINKVRKENNNTPSVTNNNNNDKENNKYLNDKIFLNTNFQKNKYRNRVIKSGKINTQNRNHQNNSLFPPPGSVHTQRDILSSFSKTQLTENVLSSRPASTLKPKSKIKRMLLNNDRSLIQVTNKIIDKSNNTIDIKMSNESSIVIMPTCPSDNQSCSNKKEVNYIDPLIYDEFNRIYNPIHWYLGLSRNDKLTKYELQLSSMSSAIKKHNNDYNSFNFNSDCLSSNHQQLSERANQKRKFKLLFVNH